MGAAAGDISRIVDAGWIGIGYAVDIGAVGAPVVVLNASCRDIGVGGGASEDELLEGARLNEGLVGEAAAADDLATAAGEIGVVGRPAEIDELVAVDGQGRGVKGFAVGVDGLVPVIVDSIGFAAELDVLDAAARYGAIVPGVAVDILDAAAADRSIVVDTARIGIGHAVDTGAKGLSGINCIDERSD